MTDSFFLPFIKTDILKSDIKNLNDLGILKLIFKNLFKAEILNNINLHEDEELKVVKNFSKTLKLSEDNLELLEKKDPGFQARFKNQAIIKEKIEILYRDSYIKKAEIFFYENQSKFSKYIYSLIRNKDRNTIFELYYQCLFDYKQLFYVYFAHTKHGATNNK